jgi:formylglycine-generating enzyme required for sulfatase activity
MPPRLDPRLLIAFFEGDANQLGAYDWYEGNAGQKTPPVGQKRPTPWGLYDMHGNVSERVQDWYGSYAAGTVTGPQGPPSGSDRVVRGGSWVNSARNCRSAGRGHDALGPHGGYLGFRPLRTAE